MDKRQASALVESRTNKRPSSGFSAILLGRVTAKRAWPKVREERERVKRKSSRRIIGGFSLRKVTIFWR